MEDKNTNVRVITAESDPKFIFDTCCCCVRLRTGCLILGYLQLVGYIVAALFAVWGIGVALQNWDKLTEENKIIAKILIIIFSITLVTILISLPFTIILLIGLHKERRNYLRIYLVFAVVMLALNIVIQIAKFSGGYSSGKEAPSIVISTLLTIYFLMVLRSHYIKMGIRAQNVSTQHYQDGLLMQTA